MATSQETNKQPHDLVVEMPEGTVEANKQPEEAGTYSKDDKGDDESASEIEEEDSMSSQEHHSSPDPNWLANFKQFRDAAERNAAELMEGPPPPPLYKRFGRWMANIVSRSNLFADPDTSRRRTRLPFEKLMTQKAAADQSEHKWHIHSIFEEWNRDKFEKWRDLETIPLTSGGDTVLHLAVSLNRSSFVEGLVPLMNPQDLEIPNEDGNTAFCICASSGHLKFAEIMFDKNSELHRIAGHNGMFPIQMAASGGHRSLLRLIYRRESVDRYLDFRLHVRLFFATLENGMYDMAYYMLYDHPILATARDDGGFTALHVLARKPPNEPGQVNQGEEPNDYTDLTEKLWAIIQFMEHNEMLDLIRTPTGVLFDAAKSGNWIVLGLFLRSNPELLTEKDSKRRNLFHISVLYRQETILFHMIKNGLFKDLVMQAVDEDLNNILHIAGMLPEHERFGSSRPDIQIQRELLWFKEVEKRVPAGLKTMRNKEGETPKEIFNNKLRGLINNGKKAVTDTANYGMVVATIIATIVFAASLAVPGHDASPDANSSILQKKGWYMIFILSDAVALFSSSSSIIFFLSVLTSGFREDEFISSLQIRLMFGVTTLFLAITTMVIAFTAACFLIFNHQSAWVAYLVASLGFLTVALFVLLLYTLFGDLIRSLYWSRHLFQPPHYYQQIKSLMKGLTFKVRYKLGKKRKKYRS